MITELLSIKAALGAFGVAVLIFGLAPGLALALIIRLLHPDDPRRRELQAELYAVPRWERPFWVCEQLEVATREGLLPAAGWYLGRWVLHRCTLESGLKSHMQHPDSFQIPDAETKELLLPGDSAKLMWSVRGLPGERMWVNITHREGEELIGTLENDPVFVHKTYGESVKFHLDHIIDCIFNEEDDTASKAC